MKVKQKRMGGKSWKLKYWFLFSLLLTAYSILVWIVLPFFTDPRLYIFDNYHRLWNWDNKQHAQIDFDNDGVDDFITFTGCAFLSSVDLEVIPDENRCISSGLETFYLKGEDNLVGQKYIQIENGDLSADLFYKNSPILHSYLGMKQGEGWKIYVNSKSGFKIFEAGTDGILRSSDQVPFVHRFDEQLYFVSRLFLFLALPLFPLILLFSPIGTWLPGIPVPVNVVIALSIITIVLYVIWKRELRLSKLMYGKT